MLVLLDSQPEIPVYFIIQVNNQLPVVGRHFHLVPMQRSWRRTGIVCPVGVKLGSVAGTMELERDGSLLSINFDLLRLVELCVLYGATKVRARARDRVK
jgi:hypothetical protein